MYNKIEVLISELKNGFDKIPAPRKSVLKKLSEYIGQKKNNDKHIQLVYICTHNSRRSHFGQIAAAIAASHHKINNVFTFSGGTEVTCFNQNAIKALKSLGFKINCAETNSSNPVYEVIYGENQSTHCFSKLFNDEINPKSHFAAIMTCSEAEQNCPFISGAEIRIGTTYEDPKIADNTIEVNKVYENRFKQIATETFFAFSLIDK